LAIGAAGIALRAQGPVVAVTQPVVLTPRLDVFQRPGQTYTLSALPFNSTVMVFVNGLLMLKGVDYTVDGSTLTFAGPGVTDPGPAIQAMYWAPL